MIERFLAWWRATRCIQCGVRAVVLPSISCERCKWRNHLRNRGGGA